MSFCLLQAFLENEDLGNSVGSVEALLQKHDDFEEAFTAQEEKIIVSNGSYFLIACTVSIYTSKESHPVTTRPSIETVPCKLPLLCLLLIIFTYMS